MEGLAGFCEEGGGDGEGCGWGGLVGLLDWLSGWVGLGMEGERWVLTFLKGGREGMNACFFGFESMNCGLLALDIRRLEGCLHKCLRSLLDRCLDEMTVYQKGEPISDVVPLLLCTRRCTSPIYYP